MHVIRPGKSAVGRDAAVRKYDALSALMAFALAGDPNRQRLVFSAWFAGLAEAGMREGCLHLVALTRFQASKAWMM
ncbi:hypothetical protein [Paracoccus sphaerophysae]|uniref:Uncharacterized protein n=1 Tax=Paracoccus sphaerophysae TaxID=690417 RepID=A0A099ESU6_9RHOB|nr:hypothetical protein [Paracoccus sphaerophysae]KGJ01495.1 hypothetical protein IC63_17050 [Paracoccus sphaerophysae]